MRLSPEDEARLPVNPKTATTSLWLHPTRPGVLVFTVTFPNNRHLTVINRQELKDNEVLSPEVCGKLAAYVLDKLMESGDEINMRTTNYASLAATIQKTIIDWNGIRRAGQLATLPRLTLQ
jgi:hypothetical protein